jgi:hypothetical protein
MAKNIFAFTAKDGFELFVVLFKLPFIGFLVGLENIGASCLLLI